MNKKAASVLAGSLLTLAGGTYYVMQPRHATLAEALAAQGYTWAATVTTSTGPVDFAVQLPDSNSAGYPQAHYGRYKVWHACSWGSPCSVGGCGGEQLFGLWWAVEEVIRHPSNPLGIIRNEAYVPTQQDAIDVERLTTRNGNCDSGAFRSFFIPTAKALGITDPPEPTPTPAPTVTPPPPPPPTPTPVPPVGPSTWSAVQKACGPSMRPGSICLEMTFQPSAASTGRSEVE